MKKKKEEKALWKQKWRGRNKNSLDEVRGLRSRKRRRRGRKK